MQVGEHVAELARDVDYQAFGQRTAAHRDLFFEVAALDVLHHQVVAVLVVEAVADRGDGRVLQLRERVGFARKIIVGLDPLLRVDEMVDHLLDRAGAVGQALVVREVNHPHPAAAEQAIDLVALLQNRAGGERPGRDRSCPDLRVFAIESASDNNHH